jgi:hypothetical protein
MRLSGTLRLLGALWVQLDMEGAWSFIAALLNSVPPNRPSASALLAFLQTAGHAICGQYGRQVRPLLELEIEIRWHLYSVACARPFGSELTRNCRSEVYYKTTNCECEYISHLLCFFTA